MYTVLALFITTFRLTVRRFHRWWWDDVFALIGAIAIVIQCVVLWLRINRVPGEYLSTHSLSHLTLLVVLIEHNTSSIAVFYLNSMCLYLEDWMARLSILFSIIRIAPSELTKLRLKVVGVLFFLAMVVNGVLIVSTCEMHPAWHTNRIPPRCKLVKSVPIYRICSESMMRSYETFLIYPLAGILADAILVVTPIKILQGLKSAPKLKRRLTMIFLASLLMTVGCIAQSAITMQLPGDPELVASLTEVCSSLYFVEKL